MSRRGASRRLPPPFACRQSGQVSRQQRQGARLKGMSRWGEVPDRRRDGAEGRVLAQRPEGHAGVHGDLWGTQRIAGCTAICTHGLSPPQGSLGRGSLTQKT